MFPRPGPRGYGSALRGCADHEVQVSWDMASIKRLGVIRLMVRGELGQTSLLEGGRLYLEDSAAVC